MLENSFCLRTNLDAKRFTIKLILCLWGKGHLCLLRLWSLLSYLRLLH